MAADLAHIIGGGALAAFDSAGAGAGGETLDRARQRSELKSLVRRLRTPRPALVSVPRPPSPPPPPGRTNGAGTSAPAPALLPGAQLNLLNGDLTRPREIVKSPPAIRQLLELALEHEWWLRLAYIGQRSQTRQINACVFEIDDRQVTIGTMPGHGTQTCAISRISWARAMTLAEEEAL